MLAFAEELRGPSVGLRVLNLCGGVDTTTPTGYKLFMIMVAHGRAHEITRERVVDHQTTRGRRGSGRSTAKSGCHLIELGETAAPFPRDVGVPERPSGTFVRSILLTTP